MLGHNAQDPLYVCVYLFVKIFCVSQFSRCLSSHNGALCSQESVRMSNKSNVIAQEQIFSKYNSEKKKKGAGGEKAQLHKGVVTHWILMRETP